MRHLVYLPLLFLCSLYPNASLQAQAFFGFQTIGVHNVFVSLSWDQKPVVGVGYQFRDFNRSFTDWQIETRFPVDEMWKKDHLQVILGAYRPSRLRRTFVGFGVHARLINRKEGDSQHSLIGLALTALPSGTYVANLDDKPYGTIGARLTYMPVLASRKNGGDWQPFSAHHFEGGLHVDVSMQRTLTGSLNAVYTHTLQEEEVIKEKEGLPIEGNIYGGATYYLRRRF
ncbi:MAG: hypothetical protein AAFR61_20425 [Bacteroidota bacterium]